MYMYMWLTYSATRVLVCVESWSPSSCVITHRKVGGGGGVVERAWSVVNLVIKLPMITLKVEMVFVEVELLTPMNSRLSHSSSKGWKMVRYLLSPSGLPSPETQRSSANRSSRRGPGLSRNLQSTLLVRGEHLPIGAACSLTSC